MKGLCFFNAGMWTLMFVIYCAGLLEPKPFLIGAMMLFIAFNSAIEGMEAK